MSKYSFLIFHREYDDFLLKLQELGVVHITERSNPREAEELRLVQEHRAELQRLLRQLPPPTGEGSELAPTALTLEQGEAVEQALRETLQRRQSLSEELRSAEQTLREQSLWGDYSLELVDKLEQSGYQLRLYTMPSTAYTEAYEQEHETLSVTRVGSTQYLATLGHRDVPALPDAERQPLPERSLSGQEEYIQELSAQLQALATEIESSAESYRRELSYYDSLLSSHYNLGAARLQAQPEADHQLMFLEGWVPTSIAPALEQELDATGYYYKPSPIEEADRVPIKLKNNFFARLFEPITEMFSLPNYGELDQTMLLAPFFMLFFGLCLGDAGYGFLIWLGATIARMRMPSDAPAQTFAGLMQWLGGGAALVGLAMGGCFGVTLPYAQAPDYILGQENMMILSIILGLLQIFFAKIVAAYKTKVQRGMKYALAPFAWIFFLLGIAVVIALPRLSIELPQWVEYLVYGIVGVSALLVFFYNTPGANPFLNLGTGLWNSYNVASGLLGDTLSYIRLFAIGLTGGILGSVFNSLAIEQTEGLPIAVRFPLMLFVLLFGHGLNIGLAIIGSFVHPLRLTFVEYYKNSEFEGGGKPYSPLK